MNIIPKILICPGDPTGIGYDILLDIIRKKFSAKIIVVTNEKLLTERAIFLNKKVSIKKIEIDDENIPVNMPGTIFVHNVKNNKKVQIGKPHIKHAPMILDSLNTSINACLNNNADAIVTGPVQKNILMEYGEKFSGHTEYIARKTGGTPIMMLHTKNLRIALLTTHIALSKVPKLITKERLSSYIKIIDEELQRNFGIKKPKINVCGLNPHAGEDGYIGKEEIDIIISSS